MWDVFCTGTDTAPQAASCPLYLLAASVLSSSSQLFEEGCVRLWQWLKRSYRQISGYSSGSLSHISSYSTSHQISCLSLQKISSGSATRDIVPECPDEVFSITSKEQLKRLKNLSESSGAHNTAQPRIGKKVTVLHLNSTICIPGLCVLCWSVHSWDTFSSLLVPSSFPLH